MYKLYDYIKHNAPGIITDIGDPMIFDASEVAQAIDQMTGDTHTREDYGFIAPPFTNKPFWIEAKNTFRPDMILPSDWQKLEEEGTADYFRQIVDRFEGSAVWRGAICYALDTAGDGERFYKNIVCEPYGGKDPYPGQSRWVISIAGLVYIGGNDQLLTPNASAVVVIDQHGYLLSDPDKIFTYGISEEMQSPNHAIESKLVTNMIPFVLYTISLIHRRTELHEITPSRAESKRFTRQVLKERTGTKRLSKFHLVKIRPFAQPEITPQGLQPLRHSGGHHAAHGVRGHLRYIGDGGLFGKGYKANQSIWIPDHIRGNADLGEVEKMYQIVKD